MTEPEKPAQADETSRLLEHHVGGTIKHGETTYEIFGLEEGTWMAESLQGDILQATEQEIDWDTYRDPARLRETLSLIPQLQDILKEATTSETKITLLEEALDVAQKVASEQARNLARQDREIRGYQQETNTVRFSILAEQETILRETGSPAQVSHFTRLMRRFCEAFTQGAAPVFAAIYRKVTEVHDDGDDPPKVSLKYSCGQGIDVVLLDETIINEGDLKAQIHYIDSVGLGTTTSVPGKVPSVASGAGEMFSGDEMRGLEQPEKEPEPAPEQPAAEQDDLTGETHAAIEKCLQVALTITQKQLDSLPKGKRKQLLGWVEKKLTGANPKIPEIVWEYYEAERDFYEEGKQAALGGRPPEDNPYGPNTPFYQAWTQGYYQNLQVPTPVEA